MHTQRLLQPTPGQLAITPDVNVRIGIGYFIIRLRQVLPARQHRLGGIDQPVDFLPDLARIQRTQDFVLIPFKELLLVKAGMKSVAVGDISCNRAIKHLD